MKWPSEPLYRKENKRTVKKKEKKKKGKSIIKRPRSISIVLTRQRYLTQQKNPALS